MTQTEAPRAILFDIERFALHDGPGIRTTVFLKGCPLSCLWCHNPEAISRRQTLLYTAEKCIACGYCVSTCENDVHELSENGHTLQRDFCTTCGSCVDGCFAGALELAGKQMSVEEVMEEVLRDQAVYKRSGGGMTVSGGEPMAQYAFTRALLQAARTHGIRTALDTTGFCSWTRLESLLPFTDLVLYDIKHMDSARHTTLTGVPNERILSNLKRLDQTGHSFWIRIPVIPGQNDDEENFHAMGTLFSSLTHIERIEMLRYHRLAESKYEQIGSEYTLQGLTPPSEEWVESRKNILVNYGLSMVVWR